MLHIFYKHSQTKITKTLARHTQKEEEQLQLTLYNMLSVLAGSRRKKLSGIDGVFRLNLGCLMT